MREKDQEKIAESGRNQLEMKRNKIKKFTKNQRGESEKRKKKHKTIRIVDPMKHSTGHLVFPKASQNCIFFCRTGEIEEEAIAHEGSKGARAIYLKNGLVFTTDRSLSVYCAIFKVKLGLLGRIFQKIILKN